MKKVFISQPMRGLSDKQILDYRVALAHKLESILGEEVAILDSFFLGASNSPNPLYTLSKSIEVLSHADIAVFANGWKRARGCKIEYECAIAYNIPVIEESDIQESDEAHRSLEYCINELISISHMDIPECISKELFKLVEGDIITTKRLINQYMSKR